MSRRKGREFGMQMLFQTELSGSEPEEVEELFWKTRSAKPGVRDFALQLYRSAMLNRDRIDNWIQSGATNWRLDRLSSVDRNILRVALAEFISAGTPRAIVINEAIEIAKMYGSERSADFINGLLDAILADAERSAP